MIKPIQVYKGIVRTEEPEWIGWFILDMIQNNPNKSKEHTEEIKRQLDFEYKILTKQR